MNKIRSRFYCNNKKCKYHDSDDFAGCIDLNPKGVRRCDKRVNEKESLREHISKNNYSLIVRKRYNYVTDRKTYEIIIEGKPYSNCNSIREGLQYIADENNFDLSTSFIKECENLCQTFGEGAVKPTYL